MYKFDYHHLSQWRGAGHLPPYTAEVKNEWSYTSTPPVHFMPQQFPVTGLQFFEVFLNVDTCRSRIHLQIFTYSNVLVQMWHT